jgi:hypothetical protein
MDGVRRCPQSVYVVHKKVLLSSLLVPAKIKRYLERQHTNLVGRDAVFYAVQLS